MLRSELALLDGHSGEIGRAGAVYIDSLRDQQIAVQTRRGILAGELFRLERSGGREDAVDPLADPQEMDGYSQTVTYTIRSGVVERGRGVAAAMREEATSDLRMRMAARMAEIAARGPQAAP